MIPSPWAGIVLVLAAFRLTRLVGWDDFPPIARRRNRIVGANTNGVGRELYRDGVYYRRPLLAKFLHCPWCVGFWICAAVYVAWVFEPRGTLYGLAAFAFSGAVGLIAKNLDP